LRQAAANTGEADDDGGKIHQTPRHAALGHDRPGQHEKRDRQHRYLADAAGKLLHHGCHRKVDPQGADQRGQRQRKRDRHANGKKQAHAQKQNCDIHRNFR
jgi:hypothetical protein